VESDLRIISCTIEFFGGSLYINWSRSRPAYVDVCLFAPHCSPLMLCADFSGGGVYCTVPLFVLFSGKDY
jgi:hypothetical protein